MVLSVHNLKAFKKKKRKRVGRGNASGKGTYAGRGLKGQRSRTGGRNKLKRLGVKTYLAQIPKTRGFKSIYDKYRVVNLAKIADIFEDGSVVDLKKLSKAKLVKNPKMLVKILGEGDIKKKLEIRAHAFSKSAKEKIEKAGGKAIIIKSSK